MSASVVLAALLRLAGLVFCGGPTGHSVAAESAALPAAAGLPAYQRAGGISGNLSSVGSDTLANLMTLWSEEFQRIYPNVNIQVQAAGSSTAPIALTERTANLGPMSRVMKASERKAFEERFGYPPTAVPVAIDALAVFVHRDNPIDGLSIPELDAVFSATRRCSGGAEITHWEQLGLHGLWGQQRIQLFGRNSVSGTYGFFKEAGLCGGDFRKNVNEQPGSGSVVQSVSTSLNAIGYSGIGFRTSGVKALALARDRGEPLVEASPENVSSGRYPLSRFLLVYINKQPNEPLPPLEREFLRMVLSANGQDIVRRDGYIPLPPSVALSTLNQLGIQ